MLTERTEDTEKEGKIKTELEEYVCDCLCKYPNQKNMTQEKLDTKCSDCKIDKYLQSLIKQIKAKGEPNK